MTEGEPWAHVAFDTTASSPVGRRYFARAMRTAVIACVAAALIAAHGADAATGRDDTAWLQAKLDAGGALFLPKLPNGECYATRGLWVTRDDTTISSDGACMVGLGPGEARVKTANGRPIRATAVFYLDHVKVRVPAPIRVSISGVHIIVPASARINGISIFGQQAEVSHVTISGAPITDVRIGTGRKGLGGLRARVAVHDCDLSGGQRDVVSAFGPIGLRVERNKLLGARGTKGTAAAGLHIEAADRGQPTLDVSVAHNLIADNAGPGIFFDLDPGNGPPVLASELDVSGNEVLRNARRAPAAKRGGIVIAGGQRDSEGRMSIADNVVLGNRGPGLLARKLRLLLDLHQNDVRGNTGGAMRGLRVLPAVGARTGEPSVPPMEPAGQSRDDTGWLQARLDRAGGTIFLPKLANGDCYATRGLWVSHDDTTITSDGACIVSLGLGPVRLRSGDGDPIASSAVFFVSRSKPKQPAPVGVTISNLRIIVPPGQGMFGVEVFGHQTTLSHLDISGSPKDDVLISARANGNGYCGQVAILDSVLSGAERNAVSATAAIDLRIEGNVIQGVRDRPPGQPAAGIDVEPDNREQPARDVHIVHNTIQDNAGPGILLELESNEGNALIATRLEIVDNTILRNALAPFPPKKAGIVLAGGQDGGEGTLVLKRNVIRDNGGPGILASRLVLRVDASDNVIG